MNKVYLAISVFQGVLGDVEVHAEAGPAEEKLRQWGEEGQGDLDASYLQREILGSQPPAPATAGEAPTCICLDRAKMLFVMESSGGVFWECLACGRMCYRSKWTSGLSRFLPEAQEGFGKLKLERRFCESCEGDEWHIQRIEGGYTCLNCVRREAEKSSQNAH